MFRKVSKIFKRTTLKHKQSSSFKIIVLETGRWIKIKVNDLQEMFARHLNEYDIVIDGEELGYSEIDRIKAELNILRRFNLLIMIALIILCFVYLFGR